MIEELKNIANGFYIADHFHKWGVTHLELDQAIGRSPVGAGSASGKCNNAYGFSAVSFEAYAPFPNRPILSLRFSLAPYAQDYFASKPEHWSLEIEKVLGKPQNISVDKPVKHPNPSSVIFYASWNVDNEHTVSLSAFGGYRTEEAGMSAAFLYVSWKDEISAALPYLTEYNTKENFLTEISGQSPSVQIFALEKKQTAYLEKLGYVYGLPEQTGTEIFQRSRRALRTQNLLATPARWKSILDENSVALWQSQDRQIWGISNQWDTILFTGNDSNILMESWNASPAKGGGYMYLQAGELEVNDVFNSSPLNQLVAAVKQILARPITRHETQDN